jgi:3-oxoacyl-[acyl-carrier-protein] synthase-3
MRSKILGTGSYLPQKILTNDDMAKTLDTSDEWITSRTGIKQRHVVDGETGSFMAIEAAKRALLQAQVQPEEVDLIVVATITPDFRLPSTACLVQNGIGAINVPAFDISAACSGSVYGLSVADSFIKSGRYQKVLFVAVEVMSSAINWADRNTAVLFGDAASAAVLGAAKDGDNAGFIHFDLYADGRQKDVIYVEAGGSACPTNADMMQQAKDKIVMNGRETFKFAVRSVCSSVETILAELNLKADDISFVVPHQANLRIIEAISERVDVPMSRFLINLDQCANTSAASLLLVLDEAMRQGRVKSGDLILMLAIGAGFTWGAGLYRV